MRMQHPRFKMLSLERSAKAYEHEGLHFASHLSPSLKGRGDVLYFIPPGFRAKKLPLVIMLHGAWSTFWAWALLGGAHRKALHMMKSGRIRPMVLAMPTDGNVGEGSLYLPQKNGRDIEAWIAKELPEAAARVEPRIKGAPRFICGLSMGGFGALRLAAKFGKSFAGASAHSAVCDARENTFMHPKETLAAAALKGQRLSLQWWIKNSKSMPPFKFDCGKSDFMYKANLRLHKNLESAGISHRFQTKTGGHTWSYWRACVEGDLLFFERLSAGI
jgi:putative tributyrin esterase